MLSLRFVTIPVRDQDRALQWYVEKLQCSIVQDVPFLPGQRWIEVALRGTGSHLVLFTPPGFEDRIGTFLGLSFTADDIDSVYKDMVDRGVHFVEPLTDADWGGRQAIFQDSEGNQMMLARP